tara:strand:+ start:289 stop:435 length:147 start_codon:yes stop_codon:yes gene_type:complete
MKTRKRFTTVEKVASSNIASNYRMNNSEFKAKRKMTKTLFGHELKITA